MVTKEQLCEELKDILVSNGHMDAKANLDTEIDLIRNWKLSNADFTKIIRDMYEKHHDMISERAFYWYDKKRSRIEHIIQWAGNFLGL